MEVKTSEEERDHEEDEEEEGDQSDDEEVEGEDMSFASDRAVKCSAASAASFSSLVTSEDDRSTWGTEELTGDT